MPSYVCNWTAVIEGFDSVNHLYRSCHTIILLILLNYSSLLFILSVNLFLFFYWKWFWRRFIAHHQVHWAVVARQGGPVEAKLVEVLLWPLVYDVLGAGWQQAAGIAALMRASRIQCASLLPFKFVGGQVGELIHRIEPGPTFISEKITESS